jgi:hypothetical protein
MWNLDVISFIVGAALLIVALIGGGLKIKEIEVPKASSVGRVFIALGGIAFLSIGLFLHSPATDSLSSKSQNEDVEQEGKKFCPDCKMWNLEWKIEDVQYEALLVFNPTKGFGKMRVKYFTDDGTLIIQEEMNQVSTDEGQYIQGKNPFDVDSSQPIADYVPDAVIMNNDEISVFDAASSKTYETNMADIKDEDAIIKVFGFTDKDLDF